MSKYRTGIDAVCPPNALSRCLNGSPCGMSRRATAQSALALSCSVRLRGDTFGQYFAPPSGLIGWTVRGKCASYLEMGLLSLLPTLFVCSSRSLVRVPCYALSMPHKGAFLLVGTALGGSKIYCTGEPLRFIPLAVPCSNWLDCSPLWLALSLGGLIRLYLYLTTSYGACQGVFESFLEFFLIRDVCLSNVSE